MILDYFALYLKLTALTYKAFVKEINPNVLIELWLICHCFSSAIKVGRCIFFLLCHDTAFNLYAVVLLQDWDEIIEDDVGWRIVYFILF